MLICVFKYSLHISFTLHKKKVCLTLLTRMNFTQSENNYKQVLDVMLVTNITSGIIITYSKWKHLSQEYTVLYFAIFPKSNLVI